MYVKHSDDELVYLVREGIEEARKYLFNKYLSLIRKIYLEQYAYYKISYSDFVQEGFIVLENAIKRYDHEHISSFFTFFSLCLKRRVIRLNHKDGWRYNEIRISYNSINDKSSINDIPYRMLKKDILASFENASEVEKGILKECVLGNLSLKKFADDHDMDIKKVHYMCTKIRLKIEKLLTN